MSVRLCSYIALALGAAPAIAQRAPSARGEPLLPGWTEYVRHVDSLSARGSVVGAATVLVQNGAIVARHNYGMADRARGERVTDRSIFHYGSITKTLTAIAVMQLRDRGLVSLDDRIVRWIPELRRIHDPYGMIDSVTIRMLLSHSAGFQNPTWPYGNGRPWEPFEPTTWEQLVGMMPYQQLVFRPGSQFGYSNPAYVYLARVIEEITGDPWEAYVQKNIFAPLSLDRSYFNSTPYYLSADRSNNYSIVSDSNTKTLVVRENGRDFNPGITIPNGGWNAPLDDLARYAAFLTDAAGGDSVKQQRYPIVLSRKTLEEMWRPIVPVSRVGTSKESVGLGFFLFDDPAAPIVGHTGSQAGFLSFMWLNRATKAAIILALNTTPETPLAPNTFGPLNVEAIGLLRGKRVVP